MAMLMASGAACLATCAFLAVQQPLQALMLLNPTVLAYSHPYWRLRSLSVPLQLWNSGMSGILQGYSRVSLNAALSVGMIML
jgi:Na+-driven multidrug efflux pump